MQPFCKLKDSATYVACNWDLTLDDVGRTHWVAFFKRHLNTILELGAMAAVTRGEAAGSVAARADACREAFFGGFDAFATDPAAARLRHGPVTIVTLDRWRDAYLRDAGFVDAFIDLKDRENERTLPLLPIVCRQLDALPAGEQSQALVEGIFAGNIFDMGAEATAKAFLANSPDFFATRDRLPRRPWLIDDFDALSARFEGKPHRKAVFFIDNAGSDFLLGALPMMRWMAMRGTSIVLAANERPTLNDMTIGDVNAWWPRICEAEPSLAALPIERVSTGTGEPLIDLMEVSDALNRAAEDADLVILEGMGRGVESNLDAEFSCDALNLAMLKDEIVARRCGGTLYDVVCRYR